MNKTSIVEQVLDAVQVELMKSDLKYGELRNQIFVPHNMHIDSFRNYTLMIPSEENAKAIVERHVKDGNVSWAHILIEEVAESVEAKTNKDMYEELIQVAAVAVNMAVHLRALIGEEDDNEPFMMGQY